MYTQFDVEQLEAGRKAVVTGLRLDQAFRRLHDCRIAVAGSSRRLRSTNWLK